MTDPIIIPARDWVGSAPEGFPLRRWSVKTSKWRDVECARRHRRALTPWEAIDLSPPPLDADGFPERVDALPVVLERFRRLSGYGPWAFVKMHESDGEGPPSSLSRLCDEARGGDERMLLAALFAYRGPNGERAWEVGRA